MISLRERLAAPEPSFATWLAIDSSVSAEVVGRTGFDVVIIDTQHGASSEATLLPMLQALDATGTRSLVRVPWLDASRMMRVVDLGAAGAIVPMVNTREEAEHAVSAVRYPPRGMRSFGTVRTWYGPAETSEDPLCIVMIETREALENVDAIAATPGLDGLLVGPVDLALSLGHQLSLNMPAEILDAVSTVAQACRKNGIICASVSFNLDNAREQIERGVTLLASGSDNLFMRRAAEAELAALRQIAARE